MEMPTIERAEEILRLYKEGKKDLFNWCNEYKQFVNDCVLYCVSAEWDYMIKKSYEDNNSPINYEDLNLFDIDRAREAVLYHVEKYEDTEQLFKEVNEENNLKIKTIGDYEVYLKSLDSEELKELCEKFDISESDTDGEVFEWWLLSDPLKYRLEQQEQIFLNGAYGRQGTGQSLSLDYSIIKAYLDILQDYIRR